MKLKLFLIILCFLPSLCFAKINSVTVIGSDENSFNNTFHKNVTQLANSLVNQKKFIYCNYSGQGLSGTFLKTIYKRNADFKAIGYSDMLNSNCPEKHICNEIEETLFSNVNEQITYLLSKGDGVVFLSGGFDVMYAFNYLQTLINNQKFPDKPVVFLNTNHYWDRLREMLIEMQRQNVIPQTTLDRIAFENKPENVVKTLEKIERKIIKK